LRDEKKGKGEGSKADGED